MNAQSKQSLIRKVERRIRAKYVRRCWLCFIVALIIGVLAGIILCKWGPLKTFMDPNRTLWGEPVATATATPAPVVEPETTPAPDGEASEASAVPEAAETPAPVAEATEAPASPATTEDAAAPEETTSADAATAAPDAAEATPAADAPVAETPDGEVQGTMDNPIPLGESYSFETEIIKGGTPRYAVSTTEYDTLSMSASVQDYLTPQYFAEKYSTKYKLQGNEAGAALSLRLESSTDSQSINPQDAIMICFESEDGTVSQGYQLMNAEIAGDYGVPLDAGTEKTYYKRFAYTADPEMKYLTLTYYVGGQACKVYFSLEPEPEPEPTPAPNAVEGEAETGADAADAVTAEATPAPQYTTVEVGSQGDHVKALQERLVALGYLVNEEGAVDGKAGAKTEAAVKAAQTKAGMTATGVADQAFQEYIFSDDAARAN